MSKSTYAMRRRSERACVYDGGGSLKFVLFWCVRTI